jgi:hypothetical protein
VAYRVMRRGFSVAFGGYMLDFDMVVLRYMSLRDQYTGTSGTKRAAETTRSGWSSGLATLMMGLQRRANGRAMIQWFSSLPCYLTANHRARAAKSNV